MQQLVRAALCIVIVSLAASCVATDGRDPVRAEIMKTITNWEEGWKTKDAELASRDYSDDADWTNAFGMRRTGRKKIQALLSEVFEIPEVVAGKTRYEYHDLTKLDYDTILLRSKATRTGQQLEDGTEETRSINHLRVFMLREKRWWIVAHLVSDERSPGKAR